MGSLEEHKGLDHCTLSLGARTVTLGKKKSYRPAKIKGGGQLSLCLLGHDDATAISHKTLISIIYHCMLHKT